MEAHQALLSLGFSRQDLRRAETKRKNEFNLEAWERRSQTKKFKKKRERNNEKAENYYTSEGTN